MLLAHLFSIFSLFSSEPTPAVNICHQTSPSISVSADMPAYQLQHDKSRDWLFQQMKEKPWMGYVMQGLTKLDYSTAFSTSISSSRSGSMWCSTVDSVEITFGLSKSPEVYIANEIPFDSCTYHTIREHELEHVQIGYDAVLKGKSSIGTALSAKIASEFPIRGSTREEVNARAKSIIEKSINASAKAVIAEANLRNAAIDTPSSYEKLRTRCDG